MEWESLQQMKIEIERRKLQAKIFRLQQQVKVAKLIDGLYQEAQNEEKIEHPDKQRRRRLDDHFEKQTRKPEASNKSMLFLEGAPIRRHSFELNKSSRGGLFLTAADDFTVDDASW